MYKDLTEQLFSYVGEPPVIKSKAWSHSQFLKMSKSCLADANALQRKLLDLQRELKTCSRFERAKPSSMIANTRATLRTMQNNLKNVKQQPNDLKASTSLSEKIKNTMIATLEMKVLGSSFMFKNILIEFNGGKEKKEAQSGINVSRAHFLQHSQEQLMDSAMSYEYVEIEKTLHSISQNYRETVDRVRIQDMLIDGITDNVNDTDQNMNKGNANLAQLNRKESKNRSFTVLVFIVLYIISFIYIVFLS